VKELAQLLAAMHARCFAEPWSEISFAELLISPGVSVEVAKDGTGFILWRHVVDEAEILTLAVDPDFRRQGLARLLITHAVEELKNNGVVRFFLEVEEGNQPALALYKNSGFTMIGRRLDYYGQGRSAVLMEKKLFL
jgi:ribosomal-protein-alanine N-acetyltransferase